MYSKIIVAVDVAAIEKAERIVPRAVQLRREGGKILLVGVVEDLPGAVDDAKLKAAVELLLGKYPHETVAVYLNAFNDMNAAGWANLKALLYRP